MENKTQKLDPTVGDKIKIINNKWSFSSKNCAVNFRQHVKKSIPNYDEGHELICQISDYFVRNICSSKKNFCYDLGSSLGDLSNKLASRHESIDNLYWVGIDKEPQMIDLANEYKKNLSNLDFHEQDILSYPYEKSTFFVCNYILQFLSKCKRSELIKTIYENLLPGGALIVYEKVIESQVFFHDILSNLYINYKFSKGFSAQEILLKQESLRGVLKPMTRQENLNLLDSAGFSEVSLIAKSLFFEGYLAVK